MIHHNCIRKILRCTILLVSLTSSAALKCKAYHNDENDFQEIDCQGSCYKIQWVFENALGPSHSKVGGCALPASETPVAHVRISGGAASCSSFDDCLDSVNNNLKDAVQSITGAQDVSCWRSGTQAFQCTSMFPTSDSRATANAEIQSAFSEPSPNGMDHTSNSTEVVWAAGSGLEVVDTQEDSVDDTFSLKAWFEAQDGVEYCKERQSCTVSVISTALERELCQAAGQVPAPPSSSCRASLEAFQADLFKSVEFPADENADQEQKKFVIPSDCTDACFCSTWMPPSPSTDISSATCIAFGSSTTAAAAWAQLGALSFLAGSSPDYTINISIGEATVESVVYNKIGCKYGKDSENKPEKEVSVEPTQQIDIPSIVGGSDPHHYHCCDEDLCNESPMEHPARIGIVLTLLLTVVHSLHV